MEEEGGGGGRRRRALEIRVHVGTLRGSAVQKVLSVCSVLFCLRESPGDRNTSTLEYLLLSLQWPV